MSRPLAATAVFALAAAVLVATAGTAIAQQNARAPGKFGGGHVYILRGFMNLSPGLDELASKVQARGVPATVINNLGWSSLVDDAVQNYKSGRVRSIVIVGHSMGGGAALELAAALGQSRVPVKLVIVLDGVGRTAVPSNVRRVLKNDGSVRNIGQPSVNHFSIISAHERQLLALVLGAIRDDSTPQADANKSDAPATAPAQP
jgi:pimeloyl-ACP methyl ester carboxylesterase